MELPKKCIQYGVETRWNSAYRMIEEAFGFQSEIYADFTIFSCCHQLSFFKSVAAIVLKSILSCERIEENRKIPKIIINNLQNFQKEFNNFGELYRYLESIDSDCGIVILVQIIKKVDHEHANPSICLFIVSKKMMNIVILFNFVKTANCRCAKIMLLCTKRTRRPRIMC